MTSQITLERLGGMKPEAIAKLSHAQLRALLGSMSDHKAKSKAYDELLTQGLELRFGEALKAQRVADEKPTGTVKIEESGWTIGCDLPKDVKWDQEKLAVAVAKLTRLGEKPKEYVKIEIKVSETAYAVWTERIRKLFDAARKVSTGKPKFSIEPVKEPDWKQPVA